MSVSSQPLVSIIIPVYNAEKYLAESINSAIGQTWENKELIIVDDGSTDGSLAIARGYENNRVKVFSQENKGASAARNKGLKEAAGEYMQFLDADDLLSANKIEAQMNVINGRKDIVSICRTSFFFENNKNHEPRQHNDVIEYYDDPVKFMIDMYNISVNTGQRGLVTVHSWLTPKNLIEKAGWWHEGLSVDDDGEFFCRAAIASRQIVYVPDAVNYYRKLKTETTLSARKDKKAMQSILLANQLKYAHLKEKSDNPLIDKAFARAFIGNAVIFYPRFKDLYLIAASRAKELGGTDYVPVIGGKKIEFIKKLFGWKSAKYLQFLLNKFNTRSMKSLLNL